MATNNHTRRVRGISRRSFLTAGITGISWGGLAACEMPPILARRSSIHIDEHCRDGHNAIRISTHFYNTTEEVDRLMNALMTL